MSPFVILVVILILVAVAVLFFLPGKDKAQDPVPSNAEAKPDASVPPSKPAPSQPPSAEAEAEAPSTKPVPSQPPNLAVSPGAYDPDADVDDDDPDESGAHERILVTAVGMTDPGLRRKHNEDAYVVLPDHNLYAIADGMGMHAAGEVASKLTIEAISDAFESNMFLDTEAPDRSRNRRRRLVRIIERANEVVLTMSREIEAYHGMGTTVVMANFSSGKQRAYIAHVGDSRCYRIRGNEISQLTVDHTLGNVGIMGKTSAILSRAVGIEKNIEVDVTTDHTEMGDIYLLCSDGLSRMASDDKILDTVRAHEDLDEATRELIALANAAGGRDNVTTILIRVDPTVTDDGASDA